MSDGIDMREYAEAMRAIDEHERQRRAKCLCDTLPADFGAGIDHARACPASHQYKPAHAISITGAPCRVCGMGPRAHGSEDR